MTSTVKRRKTTPAPNTTRLTITELAQRWGVSRRTIERRIEDGVIPKPIMLGGLCWFIDRIEEFERTANQ